MSVLALSGNDIVIINNRNFSGLADGVCAELTLPNALMQVKTGKNGNSIFGQNYTGLQADFKLRLVRGCSDDAFLLQILSNQNANAAGFALMSANLIKKLGDGSGNITNDTYILSAGVFEKIPEAKTDADGGPDQSVSMWSMKFANVVRVLGQ